MGLSEERREGPRPGEATDLHFIIGQLVGEVNALRSELAAAQTSARDFRKYMRDSIDSLTNRVRDLEARPNLAKTVEELKDAELLQKEPRRWMRTGLHIALGAAILKAVDWLIGKIHFG